MKESILYFDDEEACLRMFSELFAGDYNVRTASSLDGVRRELREREFEVVISDQQMPEIDGRVFLREVAARQPCAQRVLVTGKASFGEVLREVCEGVIDTFVPKPWTEALMRGALERSILLRSMRELAPGPAAGGASRG
jgi:DNA-binding NtrC family response regulator